MMSMSLLMSMFGVAPFVGAVGSAVTTSSGKCSDYFSETIVVSLCCK